ncbi:MAG TPA: Gfo/Idh/MocA family oxidoreductase [Ktedonobacteraceae bacterium]|jgi:predicted dehydrogenase
MQSEIVAPMKSVRWGVLSVANIAVKRVIPALVASESEQLVAVASRNAQRARELFSPQPDVRIYHDYQSLIDDPEIEAIYNPLPNSLHARWTIKALLAGKHVLCEKPLAVTAEEGALMIEASRNSGKLLMEAFMYRFHPQMIWALEQIRSGRLGEIRMVRASFFFNILLPLRHNDIRLQPQLAGGSLMDVGCYPVNFCRAVYGRPPTAVAARVYAAEPGAVEHTTSAVLDFGEGRFGQIDSSFGLPTRQMAEVIGEEGSLSIPIPFVTGAHETEVILNLEGQTIHQKIQHADPYRLEVEHFGACVRTGTQPAFNLDESLENLATIEAIYQSAGHPWPPSAASEFSYSQNNEALAGQPVAG